MTMRAGDRPAAVVATPAAVVHASSVRGCSRAGLAEVVDPVAPLLGLVLAVLLLVGARAEITLAPSPVALGVPLLAVPACRAVVRLLRPGVRGGPR